jgi:Cu+-exporting ATPase
VEGRAAGIIAVADPIKGTTPAAIERLRASGVRIVMLTGDNRTTAQAVAAKLGITEIEAEVLPERKNEIVRRLRKEGRIVAMVLPLLACLALSGDRSIGMCRGGG